ncbi:MAG: MerR family transcriptional regulator [Flavobacteriaceae bacterium]|nr:MerR family transcriptional regulator [Flavobacteriaceae bacterium]
MYSISEVAKLTELTARTLRHYEDKGLINSTRRGSNGYRYYSKEVISRAQEIKKFKRMEFSLEEISSFLNFDGEQLRNVLTHKLNNKLVSIDDEVKRLMQSKNEVQDQLLATNNFFTGKTLEKDQRRVLMETIKSEVLEQLKKKKNVNHYDLEYLKREDYLFDTPDKRKFIEGVKLCLQFAKDNNIKLGPARGSAPASLSLYALGWGDFDPTTSNLVPERLAISHFNIHIDVEFKNGKRFIDFCKSVSMNLPIGRIEAFKLPILDIIDNVHERLGKVLDYDKIDNNDSIVLDHFRKGDIEKILSFDIPKDTLVAKHYDPFIKEGKFINAFKEYLSSQEINDFTDLLNIEAIFRPDNLEKKPFMREYIERYPIAKKEGFKYNCLTSSLNEYLKPNYGVIIYQEDIIQIIREYTNWDYQKCNEYRKAFSFETITEEEKNEFLAFSGQEVLDLLIKESPVVFCKAHSVGAWPKLIKATAVLKSLHKDIYYEEIEKWESENGYSWGDFGFISGGVSLLQQ